MSIKRVYRPSSRHVPLRNKRGGAVKRNKNNYVAREGPSRYYWGEPGRAPHWSWQQPVCVCMYVCMYVCMSMYLTFLSAFVAPWFPRSVYALKCSVYSGILTCSCAWFTTKQQGRLELPYLLLAVKIIHEESKTGKRMCRHMLQMDSTYWDSGAVAAQQLANAPVWLRNDR